MGKCIEQMMQMIQSGQVDPNMTVGQLVEQAMAAQQGQGQPAAPVQQGQGMGAGLGRMQ